MYFYELISKCNTENVIRGFIDRFDNEPDMNVSKTENSIKSALQDMVSIVPVIDNGKVLKIEKVQTEDETYDEAYMLDTDENEKYGIVINPWADTLGYLIDDDSLNTYGIDKFVVLVLWEMTWFGYSEEVIRKKVESWDD